MKDGCRPDGLAMGYNCLAVRFGVIFGAFPYFCCSDSVYMVSFIVQTRLRFPSFFMNFDPSGSFDPAASATSDARP